MPNQIILIGHTFHQFGLFGDLLIFLMFFGWHIIMGTMFVKKKNKEPEQESPKPRYIDLFGEDMEDD